MSGEYCGLEALTLPDSGFPFNVPVVTAKATVFTVEAYYNAGGMRILTALTGYVGVIHHEDETGH